MRFDLEKTFVEKLRDKGIHNELELIAAVCIVNKYEDVVELSEHSNPTLCSVENNERGNEFFSEITRAIPAIQGWFNS